MAASMPLWTVTLDISEVDRDMAESAAREAGVTVQAWVGQAVQSKLDEYMGSGPRPPGHTVGDASVVPVRLYELLKAAALDCSSWEETP